MSGAPMLGVNAFPVPCPPSMRTFNSDGTRISEVGMKDWEHPERGMVGESSSSTQEPNSRGDEASLGSESSSSSLKKDLGEKEGKDKKSLFKRLLGGKKT